MSSPSTQACRFCGGALSLVMTDLGSLPLADSFLCETALAVPEPRYPLRVLVCDACRLAQVEETVAPETIFTDDYPYFSSVSRSWVAHAGAFAEAAVTRFGLGPESLVIEVASNDGYLLRHFRDRGVPVLGIEPSANVAAVAQAEGLRTRVHFFGRETAAALVAEGRRPDLLIGNNVLAHAPDINDFVGGLAALLEPWSVLSLEFPHLLRLLEAVQFDTIYHEHCYYLSLLAVERVLARHGLAVYDLEELPTHGGSLRLTVRPAFPERDDAPAALAAVRRAEAEAGLGDEAPYRAFAEAVPRVRDALLTVLREAKAAGRTIAGYGAAAKGNTLLNVCGIGRELIDFVVDANPHKQGRYTPGSHLPIHPPEKLDEARPDLVLILPWNLEREIVGLNARVFDWGGRFLVPIPAPRLIEAPA